MIRDQRRELSILVFGHNLVLSFPLAGELPMDELLQKYAGAYTSDFEMEESDTSSEASEPSTSEYEEESEEEDSSSQSGIKEGNGSCSFGK